MNAMIAASLILNVVVLVPVCVGIAQEAAWVDASLGPFSPARGILLSLYGTILLASVVLLYFRDPKFVAALLLIQVAYKLSTPLTVGTMANPVVVSNLCIAVFHIITLTVLWPALTR